MPIVCFKGIFCSCTVYRQFYNYSGIEHVYVAHNPNPDSDKGVLAWFPVLPIVYFQRRPQDPCKNRLTCMPSLYEYVYLGLHTIYKSQTSTFGSYVFLLSYALKLIDGKYFVFLQNVKLY